MKKPTRQRLVGRYCEDSGDANQLRSHLRPYPTRLLDCRKIDRATTTAGCEAMKHMTPAPLSRHFHICYEALLKRELI